MSPVPPTAGRGGHRGQPTRVGGARPSHLVTSGGVGAVVDLPAMSVMVRGLDRWSLERAATIDEPRLLEQVRSVLGPQVRQLCAPPWDPRDSDDGWTRTGVPVTPFPRWLRCPRCHRLGSMDPPGQFELVHRYGRRPDLAKWVHSRCRQQAQTATGKRRSCVPARFVVACDDGHLDDFPYVQFVHGGTKEPCEGPELTMRDSASTQGPRVRISCTCGAHRNVAAAAGKLGADALPRCRGRHPHLQRFDRCGKTVRLMVLGASDLWFSVTASALHLPRGRSVESLVAAQWDVLGAQPSAALVEALIGGGLPALRDLRDVPLDEVWEAIETVRATGGPVAEPVGPDLLEAEWRLLAHPTTKDKDDDFEAVPTEVPPNHRDLLDQVVQVTRLREVQALVGFTRLASPERGDLEPANRLPLTRGTPTWVPAFEQRGEGIFLQLPEAAVARWVARVDDHERVRALRTAYRSWCENRDRDPDDAFPVARMLLLHTLSHLLIRQVALECGYSSSSIRERLYLGTPAEPAAGILLSTAASDSEGTLGGLVALGHRDHLGRLLDLGLEEARRCSSDPLCAEHLPQQPSDVLHAAACHACLFASETSCESGNRWLDRAVLVSLPGAEGMAFLDG